ncbi:uncharacterized protein LOC105696179 [Orussus abietinus]|uniref:uncharacterized protein LOC105696179 n=1 Tax=Orussus abietinus TaxID=222816 RepID=UPI000C715CDA|nr:uncharacterized protein LOC105696179 [Orussus abietinus]
MLSLGPVEVLCGLAAIFLAFYYYLTCTFDFWEKRGVKGPKPKILFGNAKEVILAQKFVGTMVKEYYHEYKDERFFGIFLRKTPILVLRDLDLVKDVLIKNFSIFPERGLRFHENVDPLSPHLFSLEAKRWRPLRTKLSPVFTSGKLREMFYLVLECGEELQKYLDQVIEKNQVVECRDLTARFTTDVIGTCAFGLNLSSMSEEDSEFRIMGKKIFMVDLGTILRNRMRDSLPWLYSTIGPFIFNKKVATFFINSVTETMKYRKENNIVRKDFIDLLMELKEHPEKVGDIKLTDTLLTAQVFVFFIAGFETSSTTMSNALYELAMNQTIQDRLRAEIRDELKKNDGVLTYEGIKKMSYLDMVFKETLRMYPPVSFLTRNSQCEYTFAGTDFSIPKDQKVWISTLAIQRDPDIYPKPDVFDPERFTPEAVAERHPMAFLAFGDGPRNCIGSRFAIYQTKVGLIKILMNHRVEVSEKTDIPYKIEPAAFLLAPKSGIHLKISKIDQQIYFIRVISSDATTLKMGTLEILCGVAAILVLIYYYMVLNFDFWKTRGIKGPKPIPFFGNVKDVLLTKISIGLYVRQLSEKYKNEQFVGMFFQKKPVLIVNDLDFTKDVLIKDFSNFPDRGVKLYEKPEPLGQHLFLLEAERWRPLRARLSPVFTSGKLKEMFYLILECGNGLEKYLEHVTANDPVLDCRDVTSRFTTDVIGTCVFGLNLSSLSDEESDFRKMGRKVFDTRLPNLVRNWFREAFPWIYRHFGHYIFSMEVMNFFLNSIIGTMEYRKKNNIVRKDFLQMLIELRDNPEKIGDIHLTDSLLASQAFVFFVAGFETSSMTMTHALYELAQNQNIQDKLRADIKEKMEKNDGLLTYEGVKEMHYLDMVFKETLRKYPPVPFIFRQCLEEYTFAGTNFTIPSKQLVWIPNFAFQMDPEIFPKPEEFDPERFTPEAEAERHPMAFLPFGDGPRNCIGSRFAVNQTKVGLIKILLNYRVEVSEKTPIPYELNTKSFVISPKSDLYVKFSKIN